MSELGDNSACLETAGIKDRVDGRGEKVVCNGEVQRTSALIENGSMSEDNPDSHDKSQVPDDEVCDPLDTRWTRNEETVLDSKDPSCNSRVSDNTSSGDETEEGDFATNWYVPLPQDSRQSDDEEAEQEEDGVDWTKVTSGFTQVHEEKQKEEISEDVDQSVGAAVRVVKPLSKMDDSKSRAQNKSVWTKWKSLLLFCTATVKTSISTLCAYKMYYRYYPAPLAKGVQFADSGFTDLCKLEK